MSHGGLVDGNYTKFRTMPIICNGKPVVLPIISGNSIRGKIRRELATEIFDELSIGAAFSLQIAAVRDKFYTLLATGGTLGKSLDIAITPKDIEALRAELPMLSLFGGAAFRFMLDGAVNVDFAILECAENGKSSILSRDQITEFDLIKQVDKTKENVDLTKNKPMMYTVEAVMSGATWDWGYSFQKHASSLEKSCFIHGLNKVKYLGGKSRAGFGKVEFSGYDKSEEQEYIDFLKKKKEDPSHINFLIDFARSINV